jgi:hypothetical protein
MNPSNSSPIPQEKYPKLMPRKPYTRPAILHELALETRAGSAVSVDPMFDPITEILGIPTK